MIAALDSLIPGWPAWIKVSLWALGCAVLSMWLYWRLSPQARLTALKQAQAASRRALRSYDGDISGLYALVGRDLRISLTHFALVLAPTAVAVAPMIYALVELSAFYTQEILPFGEPWMRSGEFLFLTVMIPASLAIKYGFRIH